jgi:hypothetical protein
MAAMGQAGCQKSAAMLGQDATKIKYWQRLLGQDATKI